MLLKPGRPNEHESILTVAASSPILAVDTVALACAEATARASNTASSSNACRVYRGEEVLSGQREIYQTARGTSTAGTTATTATVRSSTVAAVASVASVASICGDPRGCVDVSVTRDFNEESATAVAARSTPASESPGRSSGISAVSAVSFTRASLTPNYTCGSDCTGVRAGSGRATATTARR